MELSKLANALLEMPTLIAQADGAVSRIECEIKREAERLEATEAAILSARDNWGRNEAERKINQAVALRNSPRYMDSVQTLDRWRRELGAAKVEADQQRNRFYAYRAVAELMGAQLLGDRSLVSNGRRLAIGECGL